MDFIDRLFQHSPKATRVAAMRPLTCSVSYVDGNETSLQTCQVDLDALCHDGTVTVADLKLHFDGSSHSKAVVTVHGPDLLKSEDCLGLAPRERRCADKFYLLGGSLYTHKGGDEAHRQLLHDGCDLEPVRRVTSLLGVPLNVTVLKPPPSTPEAAYQGWFKLEVGTIAGMTGSFDVCGGVTVEQVKAMVQQSKGIPPNQQRLLYSGKQLEDALTLEHYHLDKAAINPHTGQLKEKPPRVHLKTTGFLEPSPFHYTCDRLDESEVSKKSIKQTKVTVVMPDYGDVQLTVPRHDTFSGRDLIQLLLQHQTGPQAAPAAAVAAAAAIAAAATAAASSTAKPAAAAAAAAAGAASAQ